MNCWKEKKWLNCLRAAAQLFRENEEMKRYEIRNARFHLRGELMLDHQSEQIAESRHHVEYTKRVNSLKFKKKKFLAFD